jgi:hypothetical protein
MGSKPFDKQTLAHVLACSVLNPEKMRKKKAGRKESK